jgi:hypothetical protein
MARVPWHGASAGRRPYATRGRSPARLTPGLAGRSRLRRYSRSPGGFTDLFANAVPPLWPNALQDLDGPLIDPDALEIDHEPIAARELDTDAQRSQLRDHLLRLPATLREDLVPPLPLGHGSRLASIEGRSLPREAAEAAPPDQGSSIPRWVTHEGEVRPLTAGVWQGIWGYARSGRIPASSSMSRHLPSIAYAATRSGLRSYCVSGMPARISSVRRRGRVDERERKLRPRPAGAR